MTCTNIVSVIREETYPTYRVLTVLDLDSLEWSIISIR